MRVSSLLLLILSLLSCALPAPTRDDQIFVGNKELDGVSLVRQGLSYYQRSRFLDAELSMRQAEYLFPEAENIKLNLAAILETQGLYGEAIEIYHSLLKKRPRSSRYLSGLAHTYFTSGRYAEARATYLKAVDIVLDATYIKETATYATVTSLARSLAVLEFTLGNEEAAVCHSEFALKNRDTVEEGVRHVRLLIATGQSYRALDFLATKGSDPAYTQDSSLLNSYALASFGEDKFEEAKKLSTRVSEKDARTPEVEVEHVVMEFLFDEFLDEINGESTEETSTINKLVPQLDEKKEEEMEEEEVDEGKMILLLTSLENQQSIYWPNNMLAMLARYVAEHADELEINS